MTCFRKAFRGLGVTVIYSIPIQLKPLHTVQSNFCDDWLIKEYVRHCEKKRGKKNLFTLNNNCVFIPDIDAGKNPECPLGEPF